MNNINSIQMKSYKYIIAFLVIPLMYSCSECCKDVDCQPYQFRLPIKIDIKQDTFQIGDTIRFVSRFHHDVRDDVDGRKYKLANYEFYPSGNLIRIDTINFNGRFLDFAIVEISTAINQIINHSDGTNSIAFKYDYKNDFYEARFRIVMTRKGHYFFFASANPSAFSADNKQQFDGMCGLRTQLAYYQMNDDQSDNNYHLLLASPDSLMNQTTKEDFDLSGGYCFVVE